MMFSYEIFNSTPPNLINHWINYIAEHLKLLVFLSAAFFPPQVFAGTMNFPWQRCTGQLHLHEPDSLCGDRAVQWLLLDFYWKTPQGLICLHKHKYLTSHTLRAINQDLPALLVQVCLVVEAHRIH